ncbi:hypothetical protein EV191_1011353 [Tamaricihabitans halophyticus]|uniref:Uncharacterized protein n=1 Tax=Tamaricihabitans halophyticus TaxID=1262583 RepID=A0A4R2R6D8_9PSEU|nr:hypothetical protein [Tamaricihabitans halophyticus]TCP57398.1 hypothetical protein EV191_1011353 [Tamaricihabitans halophyticus]
MLGSRTNARSTRLWCLRLLVVAGGALLGSVFAWLLAGGATAVAAGGDQSTVEVGESIPGEFADHVDGVEGKVSEKVTKVAGAAHQAVSRTEKSISDGTRQVAERTRTLLGASKAPVERPAAPSAAGAADLVDTADRATGMLREVKLDSTVGLVHGALQGPVDQVLRLAGGVPDAFQALSTAGQTLDGSLFPATRAPSPDNATTNCATAPRAESSAARGEPGKVPGAAFGAKHADRSADDAKLPQALGAEDGAPHAAPEHPFSLPGGASNGHASITGSHQDAQFGLLPIGAAHLFDSCVANAAQRFTTAPVMPAMRPGNSPD